MLQLFWFIIKGFFKNIPQIIKKQFITLIIIFLAVILANAYLVVVKNEGFSPTRGNKLLSITALKGMMKSANIFWAFAAFFITTIIGRIKKDGLKLFLTEIFTSPGFIIKNFKQSSRGLMTFLLVSAVVMPLTLLIKNRYLLFLYFLMALSAYTLREKSFLLYVFKLGADDAKRIFKFKGEIAFDSFHIMVLSVSAAFVLSFILFAQKPIVVLVLSIIFLVLAILSGKKAVPSKIIGASLLFVVFNIVFFKLTGKSFADDGGWAEAGGTFKKWVESPGAFKAVSLGIAPGASSMLGGLLGSVPQAIDLSSVLEGMRGEGEGQAVVDGVRDAVSQGDGTVNPADLGDLLTPNNEDILGWTADFIKNILGTNQGMDLLGKILKSTPLVEFSGDAVKALSDFMKNNMGVNELGEIVFQGDATKRLDFIKNAVNSSKANQILSGIDRGLFWGGIFVDTMMNYGIGDGATLAGTKALSNGYLMQYLGSKNPALGIMELGNFVLFGGSEAADCISPSKTITGTVNLAYDMLFKDPSEWKDRLEAGVYGPNIKNFVEGGGMVNDAISDPSKFWNEFSEAVQVNNAGSDMWTDMYETSSQLWKLPDNVNTELSIWHPLDSARTLGCAQGKQVTDAVIAIGEGAGRLGQYMGDLVGSNKTLDNAVSAVSDVAGAAYDGAKDAIKNTTDAVGNMAKDAYGKVNDMTGGAVDRTVDMAIDAAEAVGDVAGKVAGKIGDAAKTVKDYASPVIDSINNAVDSTVNAISDKGGKIFDYIGSWFA